jgi:hypothetical protein
LKYSTTIIGSTGFRIFRPDCIAGISNNFFSPLVCETEALFGRLPPAPDSNPKNIVTTLFMELLRSVRERREKISSER